MQDKKRSGSGLSIFLFIIIILFIVTIFLDHQKVKEYGSSSNPAKPTMTSAQRLSAAQFAMSDGYKPDKDLSKTSWGDISRAREHLEAIRSDAPEFAEAQTLLLEVHRREDGIKQAVALQNERADKEFLATKAGKLWSKHPDWSRELCKTIANKQIHLGMTKD